MDTFETEPIRPTQDVKGVLFPADLELGKLIVTGPPGSGKTTILNALGGWPEEGYLDISSKNWWQNKILAYRPREVHFGLPFMGHEAPMPVYQTHEVEEAAYLELDLFRIPLPPPRATLFGGNQRSKLVFEFIIPTPERLFELRQNRAKKGSHHVDAELTRDQVAEEVRHYQELARYFHDSGMSIYIREGPDQPPSRLVTRREHQLEVAGLKAKGEKGESLSQKCDQLKLRQRLLNRTWSLRGNKELLDIFVWMIPKSLEVEHCNIYIFDPEHNRIWLQAGTGLEEDQAEVNRKTSIVGDVFQMGEYLVREDLEQEPRAKEIAHPNPRFQARNAIYMPVKRLTGQGVAGVIAAVNKTGGRPFREEDRVILEKLAHHLETAIENIFLRQEMMDFSELMSRHQAWTDWRIKFGGGLLIAFIVAQFGYILHLMDLPWRQLLDDFIKSMM